MKAIRVAALAALLISCSDADQPSLPQQAALLSNELTFLRFADDAYAAAEKSGSFWAVPGQTRSITLHYTDTGAEFMHFEVGPHSLMTSDSVEISVQVDANGDFAFHFEPSGLRFDPYGPAILRVDYSRIEPDVDADGDVDIFDQLRAIDAGFWKRELPLLPWVKIYSVNLTKTTEKAKVFDFTSFGMAVD